MNIQKNPSLNNGDLQKKDSESFCENMKIVGYMPKRKDFETEYDEDAETRVCEMEFSEEDPEDEIRLKL